MTQPLNYTCATCAYFSTAPALSTGIRRPRGANADIGCCTIDAPMAFHVFDQIVSAFPEVHRERTCGRWTQDFDPSTDDGNVIPFRGASA